MRDSHYPPGCSVTDVSRAADPGPEVPDVFEWYWDTTNPAAAKVYDAILDKLAPGLWAVLARSEPPLAALARMRNEAQELFEKMAQRGDVTL